MLLEIVDGVLCLLIALWRIYQNKEYTFCFRIALLSYIFLNLGVIFHLPFPVQGLTMLVLLHALCGDFSLQDMGLLFVSTLFNSAFDYPANEILYAATIAICLVKKYYEFLFSRDDLRFSLTCFLVCVFYGLRILGFDPAITNFLVHALYLPVFPVRNSIEIRYDSREKILPPVIRFFGQRLSDLSPAYPARCFIGDLYIYLEDKSPSRLKTFLECVALANAASQSWNDYLLKLLRHEDVNDLVTMAINRRNRVLANYQCREYPIGVILKHIESSYCPKQTYENIIDAYFNGNTYTVIPIEFALIRYITTILPKSGQGFWKQNMLLIFQRNRDYPQDDEGRIKVCADVVETLGAGLSTEWDIDHKSLGALIRTSFPGSRWSQQLCKEMMEILDSTNMRDLDDCKNTISYNLSRTHELKAFLEMIPSIQSNGRMVGLEEFKARLLGELGFIYHEAFYSFWYEIVAFLRGVVAPSSEDIKRCPIDSKYEPCADTIAQNSLLFIKKAYPNLRVRDVKMYYFLASEIFQDCLFVRLLEDVYQYIRVNRKLEQGFITLLSGFILSTPSFMITPALRSARLFCRNEFISHWFSYDLERYVYYCASIPSRKNPTLRELGLNSDLTINDLRNLGETNESIASAVRKYESNQTGALLELESVLPSVNKN